MVLTFNEIVDPSLNEVPPAFRVYVGADVDTSFTTVDAVAPPAVTVRASGPSVSKSFNNATEIMAVPLELTTAFPLRTPPNTSAALMPEIV